MDGGDESDGEQPEEERREAPPHDGVNKPIRHGGGGGGRAATLTGIHGWMDKQPSRPPPHPLYLTLHATTSPPYHHGRQSSREEEDQRSRTRRRKEREREKRIRPSDPLFRDFPPYAIATEWMDGWMEKKTTCHHPSIDRSIHRSEVWMKVGREKNGRDDDDESDCY